MTVAGSFTPFQIMCGGIGGPGGGGEDGAPLGTIQGLYINEIPLTKLGRIEQVWEDVLGTPELLGSPVHVPLRPGALDVPQVVGPREFTVGMMVHGAGDTDQGGHNTAWRDLVRLLWSPLAPLTVQRVVNYTTGIEVHECAAKFITGMNPEMIIKNGMSKVSLRFVNLDGYWYGQTDSKVTITTAGAPDDNPDDGEAQAGETVFDMPGDADTHRMAITLSGGSGIQTLANTDTGVYMTYNGDTVSAPVDIDVLGFTAVQGTATPGGAIVEANVTGNMSHTGDTFWMRLRRGTNTFTLSGGGTAEISARAAYL